MGSCISVIKGGNNEIAVKSQDAILPYVYNTVDSFHSLGFRLVGGSQQLGREILFCFIIFSAEEGK